MKIPFLGVLLALTCIDSAIAGVYKCTTDGKVSYQSIPCIEQHDEVVMRIDTSKKEEAEKGSSIPDNATVGTNTASQIPDNSLYISPIEFDLEPPLLTKQFFAVKVNTRNFTDTDIAVSLHYKGVDKKGFELVEFYVKGVVPAKQVRILTEKTYTLLEYFNKVDKWVLAEKELKNKI